MFGLFNKEESCSICKVSSKVERLYGFDISNRREFEGELVLLCMNDFKSEWKKALDKTDIKVIAFYPQKGWNSYSYRTFERHKDFTVEESLVLKMKELLTNLHTECDACRKKATTLFISHLLDEDILTEQNLEMKSLCNEHFVESVTKVMLDQDMEIDEINVPFGDEGFYMHGEY